MKNLHKLVLLDIDGTLVEPRADSLPSQNVVDTVRAVRRFAHVAVVTGRAMPFCTHVIDALGLEGLSVFDGGADIRDVVSGKQFLRTELSTEILRKLVEASLPYGYEVFTEQNHYEKPIASPEQITQPGTKLLIVAVKPRDAKRVMEGLSVVGGTSMHPVLSWAPGDVTNILVTHENATKSHAVAELMAHYGIERSEVLAIGDGHNDRPLFEAAGIAVAMGNAPDELKEIADFVAPSLEDDGVAESLRKYFSF